MARVHLVSRHLTSFSLHGTSSLRPVVPDKYAPEECVVALENLAVTRDLVGINGRNDADQRVGQADPQ